MYIIIYFDHHTRIQETPTYGLHLQDSPHCICIYQETTSTFCNYSIWEPTKFYRVYFIINYKHFYLLILLSFIVLMIFCNFSKTEV